MLATELAADRLGIAFGVMPQAKGVSEIKPLAIARNVQGPFVAPSAASFQDRSYPLSRSIYFYVKKGPGQALDPKVREFLRFVLSKEGQEVVRQSGLYLSLDAAEVREQRQRILGDP
jgi:phosphate transport system substrate-binding protein